MQDRQAIPWLPPSDAGSMEVIGKIPKDSPFGLSGFSTVPDTEKAAPLLAA